MLAGEAASSTVRGACPFIIGAICLIICMGLAGPASWWSIIAACSRGPGDPLGPGAVLLLRKGHGRLHLVMLLRAPGRTVAVHVVVSLEGVLLVVGLFSSGWPRYGVFVVLLVVLLGQSAVDEADVLLGLLLLRPACGRPQACLGVLLPLASFRRWPVASSR